MSSEETGTVLKNGLIAKPLDVKKSRKRSELIN
jgi:hypothetical protein